MKKIRLLSILMAIVLIIGAFAACKEGDKDAGSSGGSDDKKTVTDVDQFAMPEEGEEIAVLHTNKGDIYLRLFEEQAPKAVANFKGLIGKKYYEGVTFHRVIKDFMIQGGDPTGTGRGGESLWGTAFEDEVGKGLHYYNGTLAMANSGANTNGSQFFIIQADNKSGEMTEEYANQMFDQLEANGITVPRSDETLKNYVKYGGTPWLEGQHTVFGQVISGMDVVDDIASVDVDGQNKPEKDVVIKSAEIIEYHSADFK